MAGAEIRGAGRGQVFMLDFIPWQMRAKERMRE